jgi:hypothetical protein
MDKILELIERTLSPVLKPVWDSVVFWRICALILALIMAAAYRFRERLVRMLGTSEKHLHDIAIFEAADKLLNEEGVNEIAEDLLSDHSHRASQATALRRFELYFELAANRFLNGDLQKRAEKVAAATDKLQALLNRSFFVFPEDQRGFDDMRFCLFPAGNIDRDGIGGDVASQRKYDQLAAELRLLVNETRQSFRLYRLAVKKKLHR